MNADHPAKIAQYLLKGWSLLNDYCPIGHNIPLVRSTSGQVVCVCGDPKCPNNPDGVGAPGAGQSAASPVPTKATNASPGAGVGGLAQSTLDPALASGFRIDPLKATEISPARSPPAAGALPFLPGARLGSPYNKMSVGDAALAVERTLTERLESYRQMLDEIPPRESLERQSLLSGMIQTILQSLQATKALAKEG